MTKVSSSETEMKAKHVREVLKLAARFVNEANKTEEVMFLCGCCLFSLGWEFSFLQYLLFL